MKELLFCTYGSHLYGTSTPTSDVDHKVVYLPAFEDVLLGKKLQTFKKRFNVDGNPVADNMVMPDSGVETEYVAFQTFCRDFLGGQTYALEVAFAKVGDKYAPDWLKELTTKFLTCNVSSMAGFAMKQTFDYVHRGLRLEKARALLTVLEDLVKDVGTHVTLRLDTAWSETETYLDEVVRRTGMELGSTVNNGKTMRTLKLNGRDYLETTTVAHLQTAVQKLVDSYGHRSQAAAETAVDRKSLMHAVRVYEQAVELLTIGKLTFPRTNAAYLLDVKNGSLGLEEVRVRLLELEEQVTELQKTSLLLPEKTPELQAEFDDWLLNQLAVQYRLPPGTV